MDPEAGNRRCGGQVVGWLERCGYRRIQQLPAAIRATGGQLKKKEDITAKTAVKIQFGRFLSSRGMDSRSFVDIVVTMEEADCSSAVYNPLICA